MDDLDRFRGLLGVAAILGAAWLFSENRRKISPRMVIGGLAMQVALGWILLRSAAGQRALEAAAGWVDTVLVVQIDVIRTEALEGPGEGVLDVGWCADRLAVPNLAFRVARPELGGEKDVGPSAGVFEPFS